MANHYLIIEAADAALTVKTLTTTSLTDAPSPNDAAAQSLLDFLASAAQVWLETQHLPLEQALTHVRNLTATRH